MIFIIDSDEVMAECIKKACLECGEETRIFENAIDAMAMIDVRLPKMIILDVMLIGPDGFSFLNELISYTDTAKIPVVIVSDLDFEKIDLRVYGVVEILNKDFLRPEQIKKCINKYIKNHEE